jgi:hypothetical protein
LIGWLPQTSRLGFRRQLDTGLYYDPFISCHDNGILKLNGEPELFDSLATLFEETSRNCKARVTAVLPDPILPGEYVEVKMEKTIWF